MGAVLSDQLRELVNDAIDAARKQIEEGNELPGVAFIDMNMDPDTKTCAVVPMQSFHHVLGPGVGGGAVKDMWRKSVVNVAAAAEARFVMVVSEVWYLDLPWAKQQEAIIKRYGSLQNAPMAKEGLHFIMETRDQGQWSGLAPIIEKDGRRTFGAVELELAYATGRLASFLGGGEPKHH